MLENFQGDSWGLIPPLRMPSLLPHDLCHGRSSSRWLLAVIEFQLSYSRPWKMMLWKVLHSMCNMHSICKMLAPGNIALTYSFSYLESVCWSMSSSNWTCIQICLLTYIQISQEAGQVVWYFHLLKNFSQFVVIHTVKGFSIVNKATDLSWNDAVLSHVFKSVFMPKSYQYVINLERLGDKISSTILVYF